MIPEKIRMPSAELVAENQATIMVLQGLDGRWVAFIAKTRPNVYVVDEAEEGDTGAEVCLKVKQILEASGIEVQVR